MDEIEVQEALLDIFRDDAHIEDTCLDEIRSAISYEDGGVLTRNAGLTLAMDDGSEFQLTIVQSM